MSTVKNYDAAGFTNSEIEIKSGQNYDINFKNAIENQISWNVSGDDIVVTVLKPQLNEDYKTFEYFKKEYTPKTFSTQVLEKTVVTTNEEFVTKHSYIKVTQNGDNKYVIQKYTQTRTQNTNGEWDELSDGVADGEPSNTYDNIDALKQDTTYSSVLESFTDSNVGQEIAFGEDTLNVKGVAEQVASFMRTELELKKGASAYDVLAAGGDNAAKLLAIYKGDTVTGAEKTYSAQMYK